MIAPAPAHAPRSGRRGRQTGESPGRPMPARVLHEGQRGDRGGGDPGRLRCLLRLPDHARRPSSWSGWRAGCRRRVGPSSRRRASSARSTWPSGAAATGARVLVSIVKPGDQPDGARGSATWPRSSCRWWWSTSCVAGQGWAASSRPRPTTSRRSRAMATATTGSRCSPRHPSARRWSWWPTRSSSPSGTGRPVMILADGMLGQAMEPVEPRFREPARRGARLGAHGRRRTAAAGREVAPPRPRGPGSHNRAPPGQVPRRSRHARSAGTARQLEDAEIW